MRYKQQQQQHRQTLYYTTLRYAYTISTRKPCHPKNPYSITSTPTPRRYNNNERPLKEQREIYIYVDGYTAPNPLQENGKKKVSRKIQQNVAFHTNNPAIVFVKCVNVCVYNSAVSVLPFENPSHACPKRKRVNTRKRLLSKSEGDD